MALRLLLHICCGPCAIYPVSFLQESGLEVQGYFFNPNIHPYTEFKRRKESLENYANQINLKVTFNNNYLLKEFLREVVFREKNRCQFCYAMRLKQTAQVARYEGFDCYSTTLLVSPFQKHELIKELGDEIGKEFNISFYYKDFRPGFRQAQARSKELGMYRQQYCGCIYSEMERYYKPGEGEKGNNEPNVLFR